MDASIFYVDISNRDFPGFDQSYKDKGFSFLKVTSLPKLFDHNVAFGMNDITMGFIIQRIPCIDAKAINNLNILYEGAITLME